MEPQPPLPAPPAPKRKAGCLVIAGMLSILLLLPVLGLLAWQVRASRRVEALKAEIRASGQPLTADDLQQLYMAPTGKEDLTSLWQDGMAGLDGPAFVADAGDLPIVGKGQDEIPPPGEPWPQMAAVEKLLEKHQASLRQLHAAADRAGVTRYPLQFHQGFGMLLPHAQAARNASRILVLEAHVKAHRGDAHGVAESLQAINKLGQTLEAEPVVISQLVRIAIGGISGQLCRQMLPHVKFSEADLQRLSDDYLAARYTAGLQLSLMGERVVGSVAFEDPASIVQGMTGGQTPPPLYGLNRNEDQTLYLELMSQLIAAAEKPYPQARAECQALKQRLAAATSGVNRVRFPVTSMLLPALDATFEATARGDAGSAATQTAIAIERYRRKVGKRPERLAQLVPEFLPEAPVDPFDGQPLRYVVQQDQYLLYSVGRDLKDDGGQGEFEPDVVFAVKQK